MQAPRNGAWPVCHGCAKPTPGSPAPALSRAPPSRMRPEARAALPFPRPILPGFLPLQEMFLVLSHIRAPAQVSDGRGCQRPARGQGPPQLPWGPSASWHLPGLGHVGLATCGPSRHRGRSLGLAEGRGVGESSGSQHLHARRALASPCPGSRASAASHRAHGTLGHPGFLTALALSAPI